MFDVRIPWTRFSSGQLTFDQSIKRPTQCADDRNCGSRLNLQLLSDVTWSLARTACTYLRTNTYIHSYIQSWDVYILIVYKHTMFMYIRPDAYTHEYVNIVISPRACYSFLVIFYFLKLLTIVSLRPRPLVRWFA